MDTHGLPEGVGINLLLPIRFALQDLWTMAPPMQRQVAARLPFSILAISVVE